MRTEYNGRVNSVYDLTKFILSIFVIMIHTNFFPQYLFPWLRTAVPIFFMLSSYLLFSKLSKIPDIGEKNTALKKFIKRNLSLYAFWFIVLLPFTVKIKKWFTDDSMFENIRIIVKGILFGSTFRASWFITALVIAVVIVFFMSKKLSSRSILLISLLIYGMVCLRSGYLPILNQNETVKNFIIFYEKYFSTPYNSFPAALFWVACGKAFAEKTFNTKTKTAVFFTVISAVLLFAECQLSYTLTKSIKNDCYFMLVPLCISLFCIIINIKPFTLSFSVILRKSSTIIYAFHATVATLVLNQIKTAEPLFIITLGITLSVAAVIILLEKYRPFKWLKYSY